MKGINLPYILPTDLTSDEPSQLNFLGLLSSERTLLKNETDVALTTELNGNGSSENLLVRILYSTIGSFSLFVDEERH
jgi:hypothetical protein